LTHLQFADDTLIIGEKSWLNVRTMRSVLLLFEELSGLKVNFNKSMLTGWIFRLRGCQRRRCWWIVEGVSFLLFIWGCLLEGILGKSLFGNLWSIALFPVCRRGTISFYLSAVAWSFWSQSCPLFRFTFFPFSRPLQV